MPGCEASKFITASVKQFKVQQMQINKTKRHKVMTQRRLVNFFDVTQGLFQNDSST
jgi:hypothetical protein